MTPKYRCPFPDLSCASIAAPTSDRIAILGHHTPARSTRTCALPDFVIATTHKQGASVHHRRELPYLGGRKI